MRNYGVAPWFLCGKAVLRYPVDVPAPDWPALYFRLAEAEQSDFAFNTQCRTQACRITGERLLQIYRRYLADKPCAFNAALCRFD